MPMAVISGASLGLLRRGRYATFSITKFSSPATTQAITVAISRMSQPGESGMLFCIVPIIDQLVRAPTMRTSPWAKLIRLMMPYTMV